MKRTARHVHGGNGFRRGNQDGGEDAEDGGARVRQEHGAVRTGTAISIVERRAPRLPHRAPELRHVPPFRAPSPEQPPRGGLTRCAESVRSFQARQLPEAISLTNLLYVRRRVATRLRVLPPPRRDRRK
jgi:hypothetical protein